MQCSTLESASGSGLSVLWWAGKAEFRKHLESTQKKSETRAWQGLQKQQHNNLLTQWQNVSIYISITGSVQGCQENTHAATGPVKKRWPKKSQTSDFRPLCGKIYAPLVLKQFPWKTPPKLNKIDNRWIYCLFILCFRTAVFTYLPWKRRNYLLLTFVYNNLPFPDQTGEDILGQAAFPRLSDKISLSFREYTQVHTHTHTCRHKDSHAHTHAHTVKHN